MVAVQDVIKTYDKGKVKAVNKTRFQIETGSLCGLIGPDGAGKTTLMQIITTLILPDQGTVKIGRWDIHEDYQQIRRCTGYMPGRFALYPDLTVEENLQFFAAIFNTSLKKNLPLIKSIYDQLAPFKNRRAGKLSGGMKQKLALCCALIHRPELLVLDEPTTGVDPVSRKEFWEVLKELKKEKITILVSTPYMDEAVECDKIALMSSGTILQMNSPGVIIEQFPDPLLAVTSKNMAGLLTALKHYSGRKNSYGFGTAAHLVLHSGSLSPGDQANAKQITAVKNYLQSQGLMQTTVKAIRPTVEDCFISLMSCG